MIYPTIDISTITIVKVEIDPSMSCAPQKRTYSDGVIEWTSLETSVDYFPRFAWQKWE